MIYKRLIKILDRRERFLALMVMGVTIMVSLVEALGVASIMPFMAVLSNPDVVSENVYLAKLYDVLGMESVDEFLFVLGAAVFVVLVGSIALKAFSVWVQVYFANIRNYSLGKRLINVYLELPYEWFLANNSAKLSSTILNEVGRVVHGVLYASFRLVANVLIGVFLLAMLMFADPILSLSILLALGIAYVVIFKLAHRRLGKLGYELSRAQDEKLKVASEAFSGIKDLKVLGLESIFAERFRVPALKLARVSVSHKLWSEMPSFGMQAFVFGGMMAIILYLMKTHESFDDIVPILALYALAGYRLMPALQEVYKQLAELRFQAAALDTVYNDLNRSVTLGLADPQGIAEPMSIEQGIELKAIEFSYQKGHRKALDAVTLNIQKNSTVAFVGSSGSGKTTTVDVILGLLEAQAGHIVVDGKIIDKDNLRNWQRSIGYVPQQIFLSDDTVAANIAFGVPAEQIDREAVVRAAKAAHLDEFISTDMPDGYDSIIGERGTRLSGGQRQRIGIARALYHDPAVLILDEATSALDNITESSVMRAINELGHKKTIIIIAHRLSTIQNCDEIFLFEQGKVTNSGTFSELQQNSPQFQLMLEPDEAENSSPSQSASQ